jgi:hypothetical protein
MKLELVLNTENATDEIVLLNNFIGEHNLEGMMTQIVEREPQPGEMSIDDYMPIIQVVLGAPVVAAGVKGLFDIIKNYHALKVEQLKAETDIKKAEIAQSAITANFETEDGKKTSFAFSSFNEEERERFLETVFRK